MPSMRIPYTGPLPPPLILPESASTLSGAVTALAEFLTAGTTAINNVGRRRGTVCLTGAGISVAVGLTTLL